LSESDNAYGNPIYSYQMPARWTYPRMGPAYEDVGRVVDLSSGSFDSQKKTLTVPATAISACPEPPQAGPQGTQRCLPLGSELGANSSNGGLHLTLLNTDPTAGATVFAAEGDASINAPSNAVVVRSGNRNLLTAMSDSIRSLSNPLEKRALVMCKNFAPTEGSSTRSETLLSNVLSAAHASYRDNFPLDGGVLSSTPQNDFAAGSRGIFRSEANFIYRVDRSQSTPIDVSRDGTFDLTLYGKETTAPGRSVPACGSWVPTITHTKYSRSGFDIENFNALNIYSAAQFGSGGTLPFAMASNARHDEVGFEGFETNTTMDVDGVSTRVAEGNIVFAERTTCMNRATLGCADRRPVVAIDTGRAHTGKHSLWVVGDQTFDQPLLRLSAGKRYLLSAWVSLGSASNTGTDVAINALANPSRSLGLQVSVQRPGGGPAQTLATLVPTGPTIEGWQRIEGVFQTPSAGGASTVTGLSITFVNSVIGSGRLSDTAGLPAWFDDIRLQPEDASLESFVYDLDTRRMTAKLDENNFATFFRYSPEGQVDLIRRETVRGIFAVKEGRLHLQERP
jgi:hypothetical protein